MRKIMMAAAALVAMAGTAQAQGAATQQVNLQATVGNYCTIGGSTTGPARNGVITVANGKAVGGVVVLDGADATNVTCSNNVRIQLTSANKGLYNSAAAGATLPYVNKIHYTASATYNNQTESINTTTGPAAGAPTAGTLTTAGATTGATLALTVTALATSPTEFLAGGTYLDTLTVTLTAQP